MRRVIPHLLALAVLGAALPARAVDLVWSVPATVVPGQSFTATATLTGVSDLLPLLPAGGIEAGSVDASWAPAALAYDDARLGAGFAGSAFAFLDVFPDPPAPGSLFGVFEAVGAPAPGEGFPLLEVDLTVAPGAAPGPVPVAYTVSLQEDAVVFTGTIPVTVAAAATTPVPLPGPFLAVLALLLLATGLHATARRS